MPTIDLARLKLFATILPRPASPRAMPKKAKGPPQPAEAWQTESHGRISARAQERQDARTPSGYGFRKMATRPIEKLAAGEPIAPDEPQVRRTAEQTANYAFRTSTVGQTSAGYSPERHSVTICGRPVQVTVGRTSLECVPFPCFDILRILTCVFAAGLSPASVSPSP